MTRARDSNDATETFFFLYFLFVVSDRRDLASASGHSMLRAVTTTRKNDADTIAWFDLHGAGATMMTKEKGVSKES